MIGYDVRRRRDPTTGDLRFVTTVRRTVRNGLESTDELGHVRSQDEFVLNQLRHGKAMSPLVSSLLKTLSARRPPPCPASTARQQPRRLAAGTSPEPSEGACY
jgi:hypothetical protein